MKTRILPQNNYKALFTDSGKTFRFLIDPNKPMTDLDYPEFYDVALGDWCAGGCSYCYVAALTSGKHYADVLGKIDAVFGSMTPNQRPFQVALGGEGEPTAHPDFAAVLKKFRDLGIVPNYTTNGMHLDFDKVMKPTYDYSGGVAISIHPHLKEHYERAISHHISAGTRLNLHVVVSSMQTIKFFWKLFDKYRVNVEYLVMLPYMSNREAPYEFVDTDYLKKTLDEREDDLAQVAFGSNLYDFLIRPENDYKVSLYEPESMSKYLILDDPIGLYSDSHGMNPIDSPVHKHIANYVR